MAQKMLNKSNDMLGEEMDQSKNLAKSLQRLQAKLTTLQSLHNTLLSDHEKLRGCYEDLQKEHDSLLAQHVSASHEEFEPPWLKCIERDNATSVAEGSTAATVAISSTIDVVTNPSAEETTTIADENARLKTLLETGMYKSLIGHQTLCDVFKKQILNRNPRKEGVGFERKMNADDSYWKPEQYPKTKWVAAKDRKSVV